MISDRIIPRPIEDEMKTSYLDYSMSVIVGRALPDVRDGLKPVHRRILHAMNEMGLHHNKPHRKSARVVGEVLGKYHPHGDTAVYDALVRMAQPFSMRYCLVDGQGNFGSVDGDSPAAMRYTEVRLSRISEEMLKDIDMETVEWRDNFDGTLKEPEVLPALLPNLLVNGSTGIAVGMSTNIPPHNLNEVVDAIIATIENPDITINELMKYIKGPDFPTGGIIYGREGIYRAYHSGRGHIKVRAKTDIEDDRIIITELPYQVNKSELIKHIVELVKKGVITGISDLRDESDRRGIRVVVKVKKEYMPRVVLNQLLKHTQLEVTFNVMSIALVDGAPRTLNLKQLIEEYIKHRRNVVIRRSKYKLRKAEERKHILDGFIKALENIDDVVSIIKGSKDVKSAMSNLMEKFGFSERQAKEILAMRLQTLTAMEVNSIREEREEKIREIDHLRRILSDIKEIDRIIVEELQYLKKTYGDERRTEIMEAEGEFNIEDLIQEEDVVILLTHQGYIKRVPVDEYRSQRRGGKGLTAIKMKDDDSIYKIVKASTHDAILFFTSDGKVYSKKGYEVPAGGRLGRGRAIANLLPSSSIVDILAVRDFSKGYLFFATKKGYVKKTRLSAFSKIKTNGLIGIKLHGDELAGVRVVNEGDRIILASDDGYTCVFDEGEVRPMGRGARGVIGMRRRVISMDAGKEGDILTITEKGYGKRTSLQEYRMTKRGAKGVITIKTTEKNGNVVGIMLVDEDDEIMLSTKNGMMIRIFARDVRKQGRNTVGVRLMRLNEGDKVVSFARL